MTWLFVMTAVSTLSLWFAAAPRGGDGLADMSFFIYRSEGNLYVLKAKLELVHGQAVVLCDANLHTRYAAVIKDVRDDSLFSATHFAREVYCYLGDAGICRCALGQGWRGLVKELFHEDDVVHLMVAMF